MTDKLIALFISFGKIGLFSFGGGNSMLLMIEDECVKRNGWITTNDYSAMTGISFLFPGLTAFKLAGVIGYQVAGIAGLVTSLIALNMPGLVLMMIFYTIINAYKGNPYVAKSLDGMRYAATAMLLSVLWSFALSTGKAYFSIVSVALSLVFFAALTFFDLNAVAGLVGFIALYVAFA
jgi:chromate transporter